MTDIKFAKDYGYPPATPLWLVWDKCCLVHPSEYATREAAETEAAVRAVSHPGIHFHVMAAMSTISTSINVIGQRFDPTRATTPPEIDVPENVEIIEPALTPDGEVMF